MIIPPSPGDHPLTFYQHSTKNYQFGNDHPGCHAPDAGRSTRVGAAGISPEIVQDHRGRLQTVRTSLQLVSDQCRARRDHRHEVPGMILEDLKDIPAGCQLDDHRCSWPEGYLRVIAGVDVPG